MNNTNPLPSELADDNDTFMVGLGARAAHPPDGLRRRRVHPAARATSRASTTARSASRSAPAATSFQLNFSNGFGTTMGQIARGGTDNDDWYLGFNISRKFF